MKSAIWDLILKPWSRILVKYKKAWTTIPVIHAHTDCDLFKSLLYKPLFQLFVAV